MPIALAQEVNNLFVVGLGVGTVFVGLVCIVLLCKIIGFFCNAGTKKTDEPVVQISEPVVIENRQEIIAAISAVAAEELGTDISAIRILSFKKI